MSPLLLAPQVTVLFNSFAFAIFLPIVYVLYWVLKNQHVRWQNFLLLTASYVFYGWWDVRFLSLIFFSSVVDYIVGYYLHRQEKPGTRKALLIVSLLTNLGILGFFKYYGFFVESAANLLTSIGFDPHLTILRIILPVGISFYTFQTLSYTIDIYRRKLEPTSDVIAFFAFVSFFPQLVAGPIERASNLLPQFMKRREFDEKTATDGMRQMLWGFFKKVVIADNIADHVNVIFRSYGDQDGLILFLGAFFFAIQIYCDFSGYSDIAIGVARLFGFTLMRNFAFPYFSRDIAEFWRRWHISLSSWFRDYVYIPLGGSRVGPSRHIWNLVITFTVSGLWHGANWTFIFWGFLNGIYYLPLMLMKKQKKNTDTVAEGRMLPSLIELRAMLFTFLATLLAWIFFRAPTITDAFCYIGRMFSHPYGGLDYSAFVTPLLSSLFLLSMEWIQRTKQHALEIQGLPRTVRWIVYAAVCVTFLLTGNFGSNEFIYFQF
jgi:alginate O-acetyltransferase complex protein AlgI